MIGHNYCFYFITFLHYPKRNVSSANFAQTLTRKLKATVCRKSGNHVIFRTDDMISFKCTKCS